MINPEIKEKIEQETGERIASWNAVSGGCIADAGVLHCSSGERLFCKTAHGKNGMFIKEANGLRELQKAGAIGVPEVVLADDYCLVLEYIAPGEKQSDTFSVFGKRFAALHRYHSDCFGFYEDNFIGSNLQKNTQVKDDWASFYYEYRLVYQLRLAEKKGLATTELSAGIAALETKIDAILDGSDEPPSLLHGDLWSGNYLVDEKGGAMIIDPAVYYGHREADLAMTGLFGGFTTGFYRAYEEEYPLLPGHEYREDLYRLYHVLNHLNLFGRGYYSQAMRLLAGYLR